MAKKIDSKASSKSRYWWLVGIAAVIAFFAVGMSIGLYVARTIEKAPDIAGDRPGSEVEASDEETDEEEIINEDAIITDGSDLLINWMPFSVQKTVELNSVITNAIYSFDHGVTHIFAVPLGMVQSGNYADYDLQMYVLSKEGLGSPYFDHYYFAVPNDVREKIVWLQKDSMAQDYWLYEDAVATLSNVVLVDLDSKITNFASNDISLANAELKFISLGHRWGAEDDETSEMPRDHYYTATNGMRVYEDQNGDLYRLREDGRQVWYIANLPYWSNDFGAQALNIQLTNGQRFVGEYIRASYGGCGLSNSWNITDIPNDPSNIRLFGSVTVDGIAYSIYEPTDKGYVQYRNQIDSWLAWNQGKTVDDFLAAHPILFVRDGLNRWIQLQSTEVLPPAECGKPVIYLYPKEQTDMTVWVDPKGGFSKVEPDYNDGWRVTAFPDGRLINRDDGQEYPYLFWEGRGGAYAAPQKYFVIAQEDIDVRLPEILWQLGLNEKETADFMEFWRPRMREFPYYKVGFHGTRVMDELAPLKISERPNTVVRILMDYEGIAAKVEADEPTLPPRPKRKGFTVIEWGGVLQGE